MTRMEMRSQIEDRIAKLNGRLAKEYQKRTVGERECFIRKDGFLFALDYILPYEAIVIEYAENESEAKLNRFEDGDLFYLKEMDEEAMLQAMLREIEQ